MGTQRIPCQLSFIIAPRKTAATNCNTRELGLYCPEYRPILKGTSKFSAVLLERPYLVVWLGYWGKFKNINSSLLKLNVLFCCPQILVLAEVAWEPRMDHTEYLVTWEVDGGGLKGNLFTDTTSVTLSLWPDTIYHIQVELASHADKSAPLTLDTHKALQVSFDITHTTESPIIPDFKPSRKIFESRKEVLVEEDADTPKLQTPTHISNSLSSVVVKGDTIAKLIDTRQETELILGSVAAVVLFLLISALLVLRTRRLPGEFLLGGSSRSPKLIPDERHAKPIVLVKEMKRSKEEEARESALSAGYGVSEYETVGFAGMSDDLRLQRPSEVQV